MAIVTPGQVGNDEESGGISTPIEWTPGGGGGGGGGGSTPDQIENIRNRTLVILRNLGVEQRTITIPVQQTPVRPGDTNGTYPPDAVEDIVVVLDPGDYKALYAIPAAYNDEDGYIHLEYDDPEDVDVSAVIINVV